MRITMKTLSASPAGTLHPDHTYDLDDERAQALVDGGYAVPADEVTTASTADPAEESRQTPQSDGEPDTGGGQDKPQDKPIERMTLPELRAYAEEHNIDLGGALLKADVLARIKAAQDADE